MARKRRDSGPGIWFRTVVVGLAAVAIITTAATDSGTPKVTADGPAGCVVLGMNP